jgi:two-component system, NarL family, sensor kinase
MKKQILFLLLSTIMLSNLRAEYTDSLIQILPTTADTLRVQVLNNLSYELAFNEPEKAKMYAYESLFLSQKIKYTLGAAKALIRLGIIYDVSGKYDSSVYCYQLSGVEYAKINNIKGKGSAINNIGMLYAAKGNFSRALGNYFVALKLFESINEEDYLSNVYNNIGIVYADMFKQRLALSYFLKAAAINAKHANLQELASNYTNIGRTYDAMLQLDSSLYYFNLSLALEKQNNNLYGLGILYNNIALVHSDMNDHRKALFFLDEALRIKKQLGDLTGEASTLLNISAQYQFLGNDKLFEKYGLESHQLAIKIKSYRILRKTSGSLMRFYEKQKQYEKALGFAKMMELSRDSALNEESTKQIAELEAKYESEKMALEFDKQGLELDKAHLEIDQKQSTILILLVLSVLVITIGFGLYKRYRHIQQRKFDASLLQQQEMRNKAIIEAEEKERIRIARELHDGIGQQLSAAKMNLSAFEPKINPEDQPKFELLIQLVDDAVKEVRSVSHNMMPNALIRSGLASAVRDFVHKIGSTDILKVDLQIVGLRNRLERTTETVLYRVLQECVSNIVKHANASQISIQLIQHITHLNMVIEDNGKGFDTRQMDMVEGIGLKNMVSRVRFLNGNIDFDSTPGKGTTVIIDIPINTEA